MTTIRRDDSQKLNIENTEYSHFIALSIYLFYLWNSKSKQQISHGKNCHT